jgi:hypothetical protein
VHVIFVTKHRTERASDGRAEQMKGAAESEYDNVCAVRRTRRTPGTSSRRAESDGNQGDDGFVQSHLDDVEARHSVPDDGGGTRPPVSDGKPCRR